MIILKALVQRVMYSCDDTGREDFRAVRTIATFRDRRRLFGIRIQLNADDIAFEGNETIGLQLTAGNLPANTFLKDRIEVTIIDTTCVYSEWSQWERISQSTISIELSVCDSGMAFRQRRTQTSPMNGCNPIQETRLVCKCTILCERISVSILTQHNL